MGLRLDPPSLLLPRANQKWMLQEINKNFKKGERRLLYSCIQCRSVTLPLRSLFVDFYFFYFFGNNLSSQENVTLPCQLCLRLTPPPRHHHHSLSASLCISPPSTSPHVSSATRTRSSPLIAFLLFLSLPNLLCSPVTPRLGSTQRLH